MASITIQSPDGTEETFECDEDTTILDALEEAGLDHPSSCRAGACSSCAMKIIEGDVNQEDQTFESDCCPFITHIDFSCTHTTTTPRFLPHPRYMKQQVLVKEKEISPRSKVLHVGELVAHIQIPPQIGYRSSGVLQWLANAFHSGNTL